MHSVNYRNAFIAVSPDTKATAGTRPTRPGTVAALQHDLLAEAPFEMTSDDLYVRVEAARRGLGEADWPALRAEIFAKPQACLRASPLVRSYGWGVHHDAEGRVALIGCESEAYARLAEDSDLTQTRGMRSKRA
jgi:hypothetical protein